MIKQGWGIMCFRIIGMERLSDLHLPALRLLLALTGGGNTRVQDEMMTQLQDAPEELCAASLRRMLHTAADAIKKHQKLMLRHGVTYEDPARVNSFPIEVMQVICNLTMGEHAGMQRYLQEQPGHADSLTLMGDLVWFLNQIERDLERGIARLDEMHYESVPGSQLHIRGVGVDGWDGTNDGVGTYESVAALGKLLSVFGEVVHTTVRHRITDPDNYNPTLVRVRVPVRIRAVPAGGTVKGGVCIFRYSPCTHEHRLYRAYLTGKRLTRLGRASTRAGPW
jgi:hypothetical protein